MELDVRSGRYSTGDPALRWEVARVWRLGRQVSYVIVSAQ